MNEYAFRERIKGKVPKQREDEHSSVKGVSFSRRGIFFFSKYHSNFSNCQSYFIEFLCDLNGFEILLKFNLSVISLIFYN